MGSTFLSLHYHIVFSTKNREKLITPQIQTRLYEYLAGILRSQNAGSEGIGGTQDHVHILMWAKASQALSETMRELKRSSSAWVRQEMRVPDFYWQEGYGAFSVSARSLRAVRQYIDHQETHHRHKTFREEFEEMLRLAGVKYDPKYLD